MDIRGKKFLVIGGAGLIGSHTVDALLHEDVEKIVIYDNFVRGTPENLADALNDPRVSVFELGGDILRTDILDAALKGADGVFHFAALWLLQCHEFPRSAFDVNVAGTFNVLEACVRNGVERLVYSLLGLGLRRRRRGADDRGPSRSTTGTSTARPRSPARRWRGRSTTATACGYVGLRYMNVYGPRQDYRGAYIAVIMKMLDAIDRGEPLMVYGDGSQAYDFVYVRTARDANVCAMKADAVDASTTSAPGTRTSIKELAELLLEITGLGRRASGTSPPA